MIVFDPVSVKRDIDGLEKRVSAPDFWSDPESAQKALKKLSSLKESLQEVESLESRQADLAELIELAEQEDDISLESEIKANLDELERDVGEWVRRSMLGGETDPNDAIVTIHAGAGGTEACDWVSMLLRMYVRWAERRGYQTEIVDSLEGDEAGYKSVTFTVTGAYAYGYLKSEDGVHRLVRISPFDAARRRHTSFASVEVIPEVEDDITVEINEADLRVDTYRASGAGGQHVNKTSSAVRITHLPTGIVVQCQNERSQHKNRAMAMKLLKAKLYDHYRKQREAELAVQRGKQEDIAWGSQIRSYVLQPYQMVKDHRTGIEIGNVEAVLNGDLEPFITGYLQKHFAK
ncbi:MAG: peptide chain release factor 2 [Candidatus Abyssubacteria bacterium]